MYIMWLLAKKKYIFHLVEFRKLLEGITSEAYQKAYLLFSVLPQFRKLPERLPKAYQGAAVLWGSQKVSGRQPEAKSPFDVFE